MKHTLGLAWPGDDQERLAWLIGGLSGGAVNSGVSPQGLDSGLPEAQILQDGTFWNCPGKWLRLTSAEFANDFQPPGFCRI